MRLHGAVGVEQLLALLAVVAVVIFVRICSNTLQSSAVGAGTVADLSTPACIVFCSDCVLMSRRLLSGWNLCCKKFTHQLLPVGDGLQVGEILVSVRSWPDLGEKLK